MHVKKMIILLQKEVKSVRDKTVRRALNTYGDDYREARRKWLLTKNDLKLRMNLQKT